MCKWTVLLQLLSCAIMATIVPLAQSWEWIKAVYAFTFSVPDLTPNVGLFWYSCFPRGGVDGLAFRV